MHKTEDIGSKCKPHEVQREMAAFLAKMLPLVLVDIVFKD